MGGRLVTPAHRQSRGCHSLTCQRPTSGIERTFDHLLRQGRVLLDRLHRCEADEEVRQPGHRRAVRLRRPPPTVASILFVTAAS